MDQTGFRPAWWLPGPHAQTLGARWLRSREGETALRRERVQLPDGDFLDLDFSDLDPRLPLVVVLHGLEGSARSTYALEMYRALRARDIRAVGLNFRSCSGEVNRAPRLYHSGETGDLAYVLDLLRRRFPDRPIGAMGFSLGGNVLLKYLGEAGGAVEPAAAAAISVPFDLGAGAVHLERGFSRAYRRYLVRKLQRKTRAKAALLRGRISVENVLAARTFVEFDDAATAPLHGFRDAEDYYAKSSCAQYLSAIRVPTLLIHSADDPFLPAESIPRVAVAANPFIRAAFTETGGHVGFVSGPPWAPVLWAERRAAGFLGEQLTREM
ncbi:MAG: hydrolase [Gemmatimonadetes bacterium]|nr:hydrolase [Gemmatimonadota bacterium]